MSHDVHLEAPILTLLPNNLDNLSILSVGCGFGGWGFLIRVRKTGAPRIIGVDIWRPYIKRLSPLAVYNGLIMADASHLPLAEKCIDISLACEIIEHLPKKSGYLLLKELERVTKRMIIVTSPINYPQEVSINPHGKHISEWASREYAQRGFSTKIVYTLPKHLVIVDRICRMLLRRLPPPRLVVAWKEIEHYSTNTKQT